MNHTNGSRASPKPSPKLGQRNLAYISDTPDINNVERSVPPTQEQQPTNCRPTPFKASPPPTDIIGEIIGDFGVWQLRTILIIFLCKIPASWFMACIIFTAPELYPESEFQCDATNLGSNQTITPNQCFIEDNNTGKRQECTEFLYNFDFKSLIMQFDLVCMRDIFVAWTQYWHLFGVLVGGVTATKMMIL